MTKESNSKPAGSPVTNDANLEVVRTGLGERGMSLRGFERFGFARRVRSVVTNDANLEAMRSGLGPDPLPEAANRLFADIDEMTK